MELRIDRVRINRSRPVLKWNCQEPIIYWHCFCDCSRLEFAKAHSDNILYYFYFSHYSSAHCGLFIYQWQDREKPGNIPNPQGKFVMCLVYIKMSACVMTLIKSLSCRKKISCIAHFQKWHSIWYPFITVLHYTSVQICKQLSYNVEKWTSWR